MDQDGIRPCCAAMQQNPINRAMEAQFISNALTHNVMHVCEMRQCSNPGSSTKECSNAWLATIDWTFLD